MADQCPHLREPTPDAWKRLRNPLRWACDSCHSTDGIWCCLSCGHIGCGRRAHLPALGGGHSKHHFHTTHHQERTNENELSQNSDCDNDERTTTTECSNQNGKKKRVKILKKLRRSSRLNSATNNEEGIGNNESTRVGHEVCIDIVSKAVHCYACDDYVLSDAEWLSELRLELTGIENRKDASSVGSLDTAYTTSSAKSLGDEDEMDLRGVGSDDEKRDIMDDFEMVEHPDEIGEDVEGEGEKIAGSEKMTADEKIAAHKKLDESTSDTTPTTTATTPTSTEISPLKNRPVRQPAVEPGITGLVNLGNTCYMNSVLQMLSHCSGFRSFFRDFLRAAAPLRLAGQGGYRIVRQTTVRLKDKFVEDQSPDRLALTEATHALLRVLWSGRWPSVCPRYFVNAVWKHGGLFAARKQQDANEFLNFYLGRVDDELKAPKAKSSVMMDLFGVDQYQEVKCDGCGSVTKKTEPLLGLVLSLPDDNESKSEKKESKNDGEASMSDEDTMNVDNGSSIDLFDCFTSLRTTGRFIGDNQFDCDTCRAKKDASWTVSLQKRPQSLLISFRRTLWTLEKGLHKDSRRVRFPVELDASDILDLGNDLSTPDSDFEGCHYSLISVVSHSGSSPFVGHYISWCRVGGVDGTKWFLFNDSTVTPATESSVLEAEAFILLYERRGIPSD